MNGLQGREQICRVGASVFASGCVQAAAGHIGVRLPDGFLIMPAEACLGGPDPARLANVSLSGEPRSTSAPRPAPPGAAEIDDWRRPVGVSW